MRQLFVETLHELARRNSRIILLTGDLGYSVLESFQKVFPDRFYNVGVAEQNLVGIATGLATQGFIPFVYSIATFTTLRPYEFIRNGPIFHQLPVRLVGIGGGFEYTYSGRTHHAVEDIGVMRLQPGISVFAPADNVQARSVLLKTWNLPGPVYYRIGKTERMLPELKGKFSIGRIQILRDGKDLALLALGSMSFVALEVALKLAKVGIRALVATVASIVPPPRELGRLVRQYRMVVTVETHHVNGGLGSLVAEVISEQGVSTRLVRLGVREVLDGVTGSEDYLLKKYRLDAHEIVKVIKQVWKKRK